MPVKIKSLLTSRPIVVPLTTGTTLRLSPGQTSQELPDVEVKNNPKVDKLKEQRAIAVESVAEGAPEAVEGEAAGPVEGEEEKPAGAGEGEVRQLAGEPTGSTE